MWDEMLVKSKDINKALEVSKSEVAESDVNENVQYDEREDFNNTCDALETINSEEYEKAKSKNPFVLVMDYTPKLILDAMKEDDPNISLPANNRKILIRRDALYLAIRKDGVQEGHYHELGADTLKRLPEYLENPDAIIRTNESQKRRLVLSHINVKNGQAIISVEFESSKDFEGKNDYFNVIVTVFDLHESYIKKLFNKNGAVIKYKKEDLMQVNPQLYKWLRTFNTRSSKSSILNPDEKINEQTVNNENVQNSDREYSYNELVSKGNVQGIIVENTQQVKFTPNGSIDVKWVVDEVRKKCKKIQTRSSSPTYYIEVLDIEKNVVIDRESIEHNLRKSQADNGKGVSPKALLNARVSLELPEVLKHSIEVNRSVRGDNPDVPYSHTMLGTVALEDANGNLEYYAVRSVIEERVNQDPILAEAEILGRLYAINTKKVDHQRSGVANSSVARLQGKVYMYNIADLLENVKDKFKDTFSNDVYANLGMQRTDNDFSKYLQYQDRDNSESNSIKEQLAKHKEELDNMQVIASIDTRKTFKNDEEALSWAIEILKQSGDKVDRKGFGIVIIDEKRLKNGLRYLKTDAERVAYALIPKVIKRGIVIGGHSNHKERGYGTVTFAAPIEIDGVRGDMAIVVRMEGKNYYKLHRVLMPNGGLFEYKKESSAERAAATTSVVDTPTDTTFKERISQPSEKVKENISDEQYQDREDTPSVYDLMGENEKLSKANETLKADIARLVERLRLEKKVAGGNTFKESSLSEVANHLIKISNSTIDKKELTTLLKDMYSYIADSTEADWSNEDFWSMVHMRGYEIASQMVAESRPQMVMDDYPKMILKSIRSTPIWLSEGQKAELKNKYGGKWNSKFFGRFELSQDTKYNLESMWAKWSAQYPDIFKADVTEAEMGLELVEVYENLHKTSATIVEFNTEEATRWLLGEVYNQYWNVSRFKAEGKVT